jgi:S-methylmethionine-dependent homocysteine/selenocysteine methylase
MTTYRNNLPQMSGEVFFTDGGLETTLVFHHGLDLPAFASFPLLDSEEGRETLIRYFDEYADIAANSNKGFILESPTWRANRDWGRELGYDEEQLADLNRKGIELLEEVRQRHKHQVDPIVISGNIGPRGDGYVADTLMSADEATAYHIEQIQVFANTKADLVTAMTMTYAEEAIGIVRAAQQCGLPVVIGFTTETDGSLPSGQSLADAIGQVDDATGSYAVYYMVNCAHPDHFADALPESEAWTDRIRGIRANASRCSHAELDEATELDDGDPAEFGELYRALHARLPNLSVFGGCCGTDHRHIAEVATALA